MSALRRGRHLPQGVRRAGVAVRRGGTCAAGRDGRAGLRLSRSLSSSTRRTSRPSPASCAP